MQLFLKDRIVGALGKLVGRYTPDEEVQIEKFGVNLTPNMRALRLTMTFCEQLLSMGVPAGDVVHMALGITETYCARPVHSDISYTMITISQDRGVDSEPLTMVRTIVPKDTDFRLVQELQHLALQIRDHQLSLEDAEARMDEMLARIKTPPMWLTAMTGGALSAGVVVLYSGAPLIALVSFVLASLVTMLILWLWNLGITTFYVQAFAAFVITVFAAFSEHINGALGLNVNPTLIVIGGITLLVAGMMIVGAFQDAIDEYYLTATARLLKVAMATAGIVVGVMGGLYVATKLGVSFPTTPDRLTLASNNIQYAGALIIAAAFAARSYSPVKGIIISGFVGMFGWFVSRVGVEIGLGLVISTAFAAAVIGLAATLVSRIFRIPSLSITWAGIVPLVPGLSLYNGMMGMIDHPPGDPLFMPALSIFTVAIMLGFALAAGASFGNLIGRPLRRRAIQLYKRVPHLQASEVD